MTASVKTPARHAAPRRRRPMFPHFSNFLLGNIYQALTGTLPVRPSLFKRAVANGLARDEFTQAVHQAKTQSQLAAVLLSTAQDRLNKALYWNELGLKTRARDFFLDATLWAINAEPFIQDEQERDRISHQYKSSYSLAAPYFASPAHHVEISYLGTTLHGYLRYPQTAVSEEETAEWALTGDEPGTTYSGSRFPCVIFFGGLATPKEELHFAENSLLSQGIATFSFDYPRLGGNGGAPLDVMELGNALYLSLASSADIDASRIGVYGKSLGGLAALQIASYFPDRFKAVVSLSVPLDMVLDLNFMHSALKQEFLVPRTTSRAALTDYLLQTQLRGRLELISAPCLVAGGGKDTIAIPDETKTIYEQVSSTDKKLILCPSASHMCYEMMPSLRHEIAQWLKERLYEHAGV